MGKSNSLDIIKMSMEGRKIKQVSLSYANDLVIKFEDGGMVLLKQNAFQEWSIVK